MIATVFYCWLLTPSLVQDVSGKLGGGAKPPKTKSKSKGEQINATFVIITPQKVGLVLYQPLGAMFDESMIW